MKKSYDCGIKLGNTYSCLAIPSDDHGFEIIENQADRMQVTPSAVYINGKGRMLIGQRAYNTNHVEDLAIRFIQLMDTNTLIKFESSGVEKSPEELSSEILKQLKRDAETRLNHAIKNVVITVPAAFKTLQSEATNKAGRMAGFENIILLQEPIAAAVAYGAKPYSKDKHWMVFDYGGGTLDVAIISTADGRLSVINSEGDNYFGGSDIDRLMYKNIVLNKLIAEGYMVDELLDETTGGGRSRVRKIQLDCERCKIELSSQNSTTFELFDIDDDAGQAIEFECKITRAELEALISETVDKSIEIAKKALDGAGITASRLDKILLVGGSTFIPLVRKRLTEEFHVELDSSLNPMTVVAAGAAIYASTSVIDVEENVELTDNSHAVINLTYDPISSLEDEIDQMEAAYDDTCDMIDSDAKAVNDYVEHYYDVETQIVERERKSKQSSSEGYSLKAMQAAYEEGDQWLDSLLSEVKAKQASSEGYGEIFTSSSKFGELTATGFKSWQQQWRTLANSASEYVKSLQYLDEYKKLCELKTVVDGTTLPLTVFLMNVGSTKAESVSRKILGNYSGENAEKLMWKYGAARERLREHADDKAAFDKAFELSSEKPAAKTQNDAANTKPSGNSSTPATPSAKEQLFPNIKIGSTIQYGHYPQNADGKDNTAIDWQVLDIQNGRALVISKYALECKQYNPKNVSITWETCTLRKWLNGEFINKAFTAEEQKQIPTVTVKADKNPRYSTPPGNNTQDKIFLLSIAEVLKYFPKDKQQLCKPTAYTIKQGVYVDKDTQCSWWWLRSPGYPGDYAAIVRSHGGVNCNGNIVLHSNRAVRPALWINL